MAIEFRKTVSFLPDSDDVGPELSPYNEHIVRLNFHDNGQIYIPSTDGLQFPPGATVSSARIATDGIAPITSNAGIQSNIATVTGTTIKIVDVGYDLAATFGEKIASGIGSRHKRVEIFAQLPGNPFSEDDLLYTFILENYENTTNGKIKILHCEDVSRETSREVYPVKAWTITRTVKKDDMTIQIKAGDDDDFRFVRGPHDNRYPDQTIGYMRFGSEGEIWSYSRRSTFGDGIWIYVVKDRGLFGTEPMGFLIDPETPVENNQEVREHVYYQEDARDCALIATIGRTMDGRHPPLHWSPYIDEVFVDILAITTSEFNYQLEVEAPEPQTGKAFYEKYVLSAMSESVFDIDPKGRLALLPIDPTGPDANATVIFDEETVDLTSVSPLVIKQDELADPITLLWDYSAVKGDYVNQLITTDLVAVGTHGKSKPMTIELPSFHTGTNTEPQVQQRALSAAERYSRPTTTISMDGLPSLGIVKTGTLARVKLPAGVVIDDSTGAAMDLERTFLVIGRRYNPSTRKVRYFLWGTSGKAIARAGGTLTSHIPDLEYTRGAIPLESVLPIVDGYISGGGHSISPGKYYYNGNLTLQPDFECGFSRRGSKMQLCVLGALIVRSPNPFLCKGYGPHRGGRGAAAGERRGQPGEPGYIGNSVAAPGFDLVAQYRIGTFMITRSGRKAISVYGARNSKSNVTSVPVLPLVVNNGQFAGVPGDLSGCGGAGGSPIWTKDSGWNGQPSSIFRHDQEAAALEQVNNSTVEETVTFQVGGQDGEHGGMGLEFWSRGGGWDGAGGVETSGGDAAAYTGAGFEGFVPGAPGHSWPGAFIWIQDDPRALLPDVSEARVKAFTGEVYQVETVAPAKEFFRPGFEITPFMYAWRGIYPRSNLASSAARAQYSPRPADLVRRTSIFDSLAIARQQDGRIEIRVSDTSGVPPSDGLPGDLGIWQVDLDGSNPAPPAWIMNDSYVWVEVDWDAVETDYKTLLYVNRTWGGTKSILSPTRPVGEAAGTHWLNSEDGTEWILGETAADDVAFRSGGVPVGIELLTNGNFAEGDLGFTFTRTRDLQPRNILERILDEIVDAFISHGTVEGIYIPEDEPDETDFIPAPASLTATAQSETTVLLSWTQPADTTGVEGQYIYLAGEIFEATEGTSFFATGLTKGTTYQFSVKNAGMNGALSDAVFATVTTPDDTPVEGQTGIVFTHTGEAQADGTRRIAGKAYQNNASIPIASGREFRVTLLDTSVLTTTISDSVGTFNILVSSGYDNNLNQQASAYGNNGTDDTKAQIEFTYEL